MKFAVHLDPNSIIGRSYAGNHDGHTGAEIPTLLCTSVDDQGPYLLAVRRSPKKDRPKQTLLIPHSAVAWIQRYAEKEALPMGFVPRS